MPLRLLGQFWAWAQHPRRRGAALATAPVHLALGAFAWFRFGETAFWWFIAIWWAVWLAAWVLLFLRTGRGEPAAAPSAAAVVVFALVAVAGAVAPDRYLQVVAGGLGLCAWVAALLVVGRGLGRGGSGVAGRR